VGEIRRRSTVTVGKADHLVVTKANWVVGAPSDRDLALVADPWLLSLTLPLLRRADQGRRQGLRAPRLDKRRRCGSVLSSQVDHSTRLAAAGAAAAVELEDVAAAASAILATCGDCHRAAGTMPAHALPPSPTVGGQVGQVLAHQQAVDLMVQGLTVPSAWLWQSGAEALERAPLRKAILPADHKLTKDPLAAEQAVHHLAERARAATDQRSRIYVYSELVQSCATCHSRLGGVSGPDEK
jgi:cytochrome c553